MKQSGLKVDVTLIQGKGGVFVVKADGQAVWDKAKTERFPEDHEIVAMLTDRLRPRG